MEITLPTQAGMVGATLYAQWAILAGARLTTTNALRIKLAATAGPLDGSVVVSKGGSGATLPASGAVDVATMAVVQVDYR